VVERRKPMQRKRRNLGISAKVAGVRRHGTVVENKRMDKNILKERRKRKS